MERPTFPEAERQLQALPEDTAEAAAARLSKCESEVMRMSAEGLSMMEIAERAGRRRKTVSTQKMAAMRKLGLQRDVDVFAHGIVQASQQARAAASGSSGDGEDA